MIIQTVVMVAGGFVYMQKREDAIMYKIEQMKRDIEGIKGNYLDRFDDLKAVLATMHTQITSQITALDKRMEVYIAKHE